MMGFTTVDSAETVLALMDPESEPAWIDAEAQLRQGDKRQLGPLYIGRIDGGWQFQAQGARVEIIGTAQFIVNVIAAIFGWPGYPYGGWGRGPLPGHFFRRRGDWRIYADRVVT